MNIAFGNGRIHEVIYTQRIMNITKVIVLKRLGRSANLGAKRKTNFRLTSFDVNLATG